LPELNPNLLYVTVFPQGTKKGRNGPYDNIPQQQQPGIFLQSKRHAACLQVKMRFHQIIASSIMSQVEPVRPNPVSLVHEKGPCQEP
jgi:hypothetical protein